MNFLIFFIFCLISLISVNLAEQLYHREGRFIDFSLNKYKTQLPSIKDVSNVLTPIVHYRVPITIFVPTVRLNTRQKQKRIYYNNFQSTSKKVETVSQSVQDSQNKLPAINEKEVRSSNDKKDNFLLPVISRNGWVARSRSLNNKSRLRLLNELPNGSSLNYASTLPSESNLDLIPFLYKDSLYKDSIQRQSPNLFNSQYQLANSNPTNLFSQNIAYIQPNSLRPFQPNILVLTSSGQQSMPNQIKNSNQSIPINQQQNNSLSILNGTLPTINQLISSNQTANQSTNQPDELISKKVDQFDILISKPSIANNSLSPDLSTTQFDVSQVSDNSDEISTQEYVQNHEPLENISAGSVINSIESETINNLNNSINNINQLISNASNSIERTERQLNFQPFQINPHINNENFFIDPRRPNLVKRYYVRSAEPKSQLRQKKLLSNRSQRSLFTDSIDLPSYACLYTAAAAQSGHSNRDRENLFPSFLNSN